jgi:hypothetical protein
MKAVVTKGLGALALVGAALGAAVALRDRPGGIGWFWGVAFGSVDQGPVAFSTLQRRKTPNDALVCPPWLCRTAVDVPSSLYALPADELRRRLVGVILAGGDSEQVATAAGDAGDRFVVRTRWMRFPDTVDVLVLPQGEGRSTLALYSRSLVGLGDMGVNRRRLEGWLSAPALKEAERGPSRAPAG